MTITALLPVYCVHESYNPTVLPSRGTSLKVQPRLGFNFKPRVINLRFRVPSPVLSFRIRVLNGLINCKLRGLNFKLWVRNFRLRVLNSIPGSLIFGLF